VKPIVGEGTLQQAERFRIWRKHIREALDKPDHQQTVRIYELDLQFYVKRESSSRGDTILVVICQEREQKWHVASCWRLPPDLAGAADIDITDPLALMRRLALKYGLAFKIGQQRKRFILQEIVPLGTEAVNPGTIVSIENPNNRSFAQVMFLKLEKRDEGMVAVCALACCIDKDKYRDALFGRKTEAAEEDVA
jgi:hypothetical protein